MYLRKESKRHLKPVRRAAFFDAISVQIGHTLRSVWRSCWRLAPLTFQIAFLWSALNREYSRLAKRLSIDGNSSPGSKRMERFTGSSTNGVGPRHRCEQPHFSNTVPTWRTPRKPTSESGRRARNRRLGSYATRAPLIRCSTSRISRKEVLL